MAVFPHGAITGTTAPRGRRRRGLKRTRRAVHPSRRNVKTALALPAACLLAACAECETQDHRGCACASGARASGLGTAEKTFRPVHLRAGAGPHAGADAAADR